MANKKNDTSSVNLLDLFWYLLSYWYWFVLCVLLVVGYQYYKYQKTPFVYKSDASVVIKNPSNTLSTVRMDSYSNLINRTNVSNEILQFQSKRLMTQAVKRLRADVEYTRMEGLRVSNLYRKGPVEVVFTDPNDVRRISFQVSPKDESSVTLIYNNGNKEVVAVNDTVDSAIGKIIVVPTPNYGSNWYGQTINVQKHNPADMAVSFLGRTTIRQTNDAASLLSLSIQDYSPQRGIDVLNTLIDIYNEDAINDKNLVAQNTAEFINERLLIIEQELGDVEGQIEDFQRSNRLLSVSQTAGEYLSDSRQSNAEALQIETNLRIAESMRDYLSDHGSTTDLIPADTGLGDLRTEGQIAQYNATKLRRDKLLQDSGPNNPVIQDLDKQLGSLKESIVSSVDNLVSGLTVKRNDAVAQEYQSLARFSAMPGKARELLGIERQQEIKSSLYMYLLNRREENALTQAMADTNARIIDPAESSGMPIYPIRKRMILLGILIGLAIPALILIARLFLDTKVRNRKEVEDSVSAPFIGEIPLYESYKKQNFLQRFLSKRKKKKNADDDKLIKYNKNSRNVFTEAFRSLCTNMDYMRTDGDKAHVMTLTSFNVGAGKTFVATNMAACLADSDKKVVVLDMDLRKRTLSKRFGFKHGYIGVSNYLSDNTLGLEDIIKHNVQDGIDLIPAGHIPPNPVELLRKDRFDQLIEQLKEKYDYILMDNVPVEIVADTRVINRVVDTTAFVIKSGVIDRRALEALEEMYQENRYRNIGVILNGCEIRKTYGSNYGYGYSYGYGYGYGYGGSYGYGDDEEDTATKRSKKKS